VRKVAAELLIDARPPSADNPHAVTTIPRRVPLHEAFRTGNELKYVSKVITSGEIASEGSFTRDCSKLLQRAFGVHKALLVPSGTAALEMAAILCGLGPGDEVILPSFTFPSTANAIVRTGAKPVFVDIRPDTMNLDERLIEAQITARTKAIFPVHYAGVSCDMDTIMAIASKHNLLVVEDAAQAVNSRFRGRACGSMGHLAAFSFHSTKDYTCGEGGALCINSPGMERRAEVLREKGTDRARFLRGEVDKYTWVDVGSSYLPSELTSAYLLAQLEGMERIRSARQAVYNRYLRLLAPLEERGVLRLPKIPAECDGNYHLFYILLPDGATRNRLLTHLTRNGIGAAFHFVPLHLSPMGRQLSYSEDDLPFTEDLSQRLLRLPMYPALSAKQQKIVAESLNDFFGRAILTLKRPARSVSTTWRTQT
jgi:dTDP-4-amino-4,6-dideoxygalactose transaminase